MAAPTRTARVRQILDTAAGHSPADYGGLGRFWTLPLDEFRAAMLGDVRLLPDADARPEGSACCCTGSTAEETGSCNGVGDASGLVRGLRGQAPFDGTQFPRLPWGGAPVADDDIAFIAAWIDDGCPDDDRVLTDAPLELEARPTLEPIGASNLETAARDALGLYSAAPARPGRAGELKQRMNIDCMTEDDLDRLRAAFRELYALNRWPEDARNYNNLALIHQNHCQHGWERFLPWHRIYLYQFEQALQDIDPSVTMPYWDWTMPQYTPARPDLGWRIPPALQGWVTDQAMDDAGIPATIRSALSDAGVDGTRYTSLDRFFRAVAEAGVSAQDAAVYRNRFIDAMLATNALWYPLRYPGEYQNAAGDPSTINKVIHYHYPTADDIAQILSLRSFRDFGGGSIYNESFGFLDQNPHNTLHIWTGGMNPNANEGPIDGPRALVIDRNRGVRVAGRQFHSRNDMYGQPTYGDMFSNLTAAYDPVFWPVHANVDRLWHEWQLEHPHSLPADLDAVLTPWSYTIADTIDMHQFGYEYVKMAYIVPVGLEAPVGRFTSAPVRLKKPVRESFRQVEVRLHKVPQLPRSCFVRVFLNLPDANADTPLDDEHYAGYLAVFGHGPCYGGPGHCDLPGPRRAFDRRPRSHNAPRNHRIDVTRTARRLVDAGATSLQITLVVIGADYREDSEVLRLDGVSLNVLD